jgi:hypothetical protein
MHRLLRNQNGCYRVRKSQLPASVQTTRHNIPDDSHIHTRRHENLKSRLKRYKFWVIFTEFCAVSNFIKIRPVVLEMKHAGRMDRYDKPYIYLFYANCKQLIQLLSVCLSMITALWDVAPCSLVEVHRRFRGAYCLHLQRLVFFILTTVRTWNLTKSLCLPSTNLTGPSYWKNLMNSRTQRYDRTIHLETS